MIKIDQKEALVFYETLVCYQMKQAIHSIVSHFCKNIKKNTTQLNELLASFVNIH